MKKLILLSLLLMAVAVTGTQAASLRQIQLEIVDEFWQPVTSITQISVFDAGTSSAATIFSDRTGDISITNPITTSSTNTTFDQSLGFVRWFQRAPDYKVTITDGTKTLTIDNRTGSVTRFPWYDNYIGTAASLSVNDNQSITVGSDSDAVLSWVNASDILNWIPNVDGVDFNIGSTTVAKQFDFNVFVGGIGGGGLAIDEGASTFGWTGGVFNVNASSNFATNINTGTSTGAVSIGSSTSGVLTVDGTSTGTINVDDALSITNSSASADITVDSVAGSVLVDAGESASDALTLAATGGAGGVTVSSGTGDITLDSGDDIFLAADTDTGDVISLINTQGTAEGATILRSVVGGIDIDFATAKNMAVTGGQFIFTSNEDVASAFSVITNTGTSESITFVNTQGEGTGAITFTTTAAGDIDVNSGDDMTVDVADDMTVTVVGDYTLAVTGATVLPDDVLLKKTIAISAAEADNLAGSPKELVAAVAASTHEFVKIIIALDWNSVAYTESGDNLAVRYTNGSGVIVSDVIEATGLADATEDTLVFAIAVPTTSALVTAAASTNKALVLDNTGSEWGNSGDSPLSVIIYYRTHTTAELGL